MSLKDWGTQLKSSVKTMTRPKHRSSKVGNLDLMSGLTYKSQYTQFTQGQSKYQACVRKKKKSSSHRARLANSNLFTSKFSWSSHSQRQLIHRKLSNGSLFMRMLMLTRLEMLPNYRLAWNLSTAKTLRIIGPHGISTCCL